MKLVVATNDERRSAHLERIVRQIRRDKQRGDAFLPQLMVDKLHALHRVFRSQITQLGKANGRKMSAVKQRNETTRELCYLVRDVYVMAKRKYERGKLSEDALAAHVIPKEPVRDNERKTASWVVRAEHILDGDLTHSATNPTILRDPTREELQTAMEAADGAHQEAIDAVDHLGNMQTRMQELRRELDQLLLRARHALVGAFFQLEGPSLRDVLHAYGYHYKGKRRQKPQPKIQVEPPPTPEPKMEEPAPPTPEAKEPIPIPEPETRKPAPPKPEAKKPAPRITQDHRPTTIPNNDPIEEQSPPSINVDKLPKDFQELITIQEKPESPKAPPKTKGSNRKSPTAKEKEKKKARRKQARQSRKQNR